MSKITLRCKMRTLRCVFLFSLSAYRCAMREKSVASTSMPSAGSDPNAAGPSSHSTAPGDMARVTAWVSCQQGNRVVAIGRTTVVRFALPSRHVPLLSSATTAPGMWRAALRLELSLRLPTHSSGSRRRALADGGATSTSERRGATGHTSADWAC